MEAPKATHYQHIAVAVLIALQCSGRAPAAQDEPATRPRLPVPAVDAKPVVDGKPDETCWKSAATTGILKVARGNPSMATTAAFFVRDADHLYVGIRCGGECKAAGEFVELAIDSNADGNSYYLIRVAPATAGVTSSYNEHDPPWIDQTWQPAIKAVIAKGQGAWTAELALPLVALCKNKKLASEVGLNIRRSGMPGGETHCWQGPGADPNEWAVLTGIPPRENLPGPEYSVHGLSRFYRPPNRAGRSFLAEQCQRTISLGPGSAHPGSTGEVKLELEGVSFGGRSTRQRDRLGPCRRRAEGRALRTCRYEVGQRSGRVASLRSTGQAFTDHHAAQSDLAPVKRAGPRPKDGPRGFSGAGPPESVSSVG